MWSGAAPRRPSPAAGASPLLACLFCFLFGNSGAARDVLLGARRAAYTPAARHQTSREPRAQVRAHRRVLRRVDGLCRAGGGTAQHNLGGLRADGRDHAAACRPALHARHGENIARADAAPRPRRLDRHAGAVHPARHRSAGASARDAACCHRGQGHPALPCLRRHHTRALCPCLASHAGWAGRRCCRRRANSCSAVRCCARSSLRDPARVIVDATRPRTVLHCVPCRRRAQRTSVCG